MKIQIKYDVPFDFELTLRSHGWVYLSPFILELDKPGYRRDDKLASGKRVSYTVIPSKKDSIEIQTDSKLKASEKEELISLVNYSLRLEEDLSEFYELCRKQRKMKFVAQKGLGRLLRGTSLFEDLVKTLCTTNTTWQHTTTMVANLVTQIGEGVFPNSADILNYGRKKFEADIKLGYRADYLWELCERLESGDIVLNTEQLRRNSCTEVAKVIKSLKGFGDYAVNHALLMIGHYDNIPIDSVVRQYFKETYNIKNVTKKQIDKRYAKWGKWQFLAFQFERIGERYNLC